MGMFDTIRSSYRIFGEPYDNNLQTKSLTCIMATYWIDPVGRLFEVDYSDTQDWVEKPQEERKHMFDKYTTVPNGRKGAVRATGFYGHLHVTAAKQTDWERTLIFEAGILVSDGGADISIVGAHLPW